MSQKVIVIGIDGATWDLIEPWCKGGKLPALAKVLSEGVQGFLESTVPPITAPAWVSFSTGKNPGKHGIFDFIRVDEGKIVLNRSKDIKSTPFYDMLSAKGIRSTVIGLPLSYPPSKNFNGTMVSDFLYPSKEIFPPEKSECISEYRVSSDPAKAGDDLLDDMLDTTRSQIELAKKLFSEDDWQFYFILFRETDTVFHSFWKELKNKTQFGEKAAEVFRIVDDFLHWILEEITDDTALFVISDHGFADHNHIVRINRILLEKGLLITKIVNKSTGSPLEGHVKTAFGGKKRQEIGLPRFVYRIAFHPLAVRISRGVHRHIFGRKELKYLKRVDYENSKAYNPTPLSSAIYISRKLSRDEYGLVRVQVMEILENLEYGGRKVVKEVLSKDRVYSGPYADEGPDLLVVTNGFILDSGLTQRVFDDFGPGSYHHQMGIFAAYGSKIKKGFRLEGARIYDVAPTILYLFDFPIPEDLDGRVLTEIFIESEISARKPRYDGIDHAGEMRRLKDAIGKLKGSERL